MNIIRSLILWIRFMVKVLFISPRLFISIIWEYCINRFLLKKIKTIAISFNWTVLEWPNEHGFFYTAIEVYYRQLYIKLKWCNNILDLGWYLWESAVWLSLYNNKVIVVEPNPSNFNYLNKNIKNYKNISAIEWAIVYKKQWQLYHQGWDFSAWGNITIEPTDTPINNILIQKIRNKQIDGLKMDIEWWEYDIINFLQTEEGLQLKKWYIEFHNIHDNKKYILHYITHLEKHSYHIEYENIYWKLIHKNDFFNNKIAVIFFYK